jgi:general secretion pathway protein A
MERGAPDMGYMQYYGFSRIPFGEDPDCDAVFPAQTHKEALAITLYGIRNRKGYIVIFGEQGMGKTTLIRQVMHKIGEQTQVVLISQSHDLYIELLRELMEKLGLRARGVSKGSMLKELYEYLIQCLQQGRNFVIILDDAHRIKDQIIEELRLLSNLETSRSKLIQIVIVGGPELDRRLNSKLMRQIRQRIQIFCHLLPLGRDDSLRYIEHRMAWAGGSSRAIFTPEALESICRYAGGIPRNINGLCDRTLALGAERSEKPISAGTATDARRTAIPLLRPKSKSPARAQAGKSALRSVWLYSALAVAATGILLGSYFLSRTSGTPPRSAVVMPVPDRMVSDADEAAKTQSAKGQQLPGLPEGKEEPRPVPPPDGVPASTAKKPKEASTLLRKVYIAEGSTLWSITTRYYGFANATALDCILESNPEIGDADLIQAGSQILLPQGAGRPRFLKRPEGSFDIHAATFMTYREAGVYAGKIGPDIGRVGIVKKRVGSGKDWYRVVVGPFGSMKKALKALETLESRGAP